MHMRSRARKRCLSKCKGIRKTELFCTKESCSMVVNQDRGICRNGIVEREVGVVNIYAKRIWAIMEQKPRNIKEAVVVNCLVQCSLRDSDCFGFTFYNHEWTHCIVVNNSVGTKTFPIQ